MLNLNKRVKLRYSEKLSVDYNSKSFWNACKPYFSDKSSNVQENKMLIEKGESENYVASTFNKLEAATRGALQKKLFLKITVLECLFN